MQSISKVNFEEKVLKNQKMVVVVFSGENCVPCQKLHPVMEKITENYKDKDYIDFFEINIHSNEEIFGRFNVMTIPHTIFFNNGKQADEVIGFKDEDAILEFLKRNIVSLSKPEYFIE